MAIVASLVSLVGYTFSAAEQQELIALATTVAGSVGGLVAMYGRVKATKKIGKK